MPERELIVYGVNWCGDCQRVRSFLMKNQIEFEFINIDDDKEGEQIVLKHNHGFRSVPTIVFPDGTIMVEPSISELSTRTSQFM